MGKHGKMIRVWSDLDPNEVTKHLILVDDHYGMCANCKQTGLVYFEHKSCPNCKTEFRYLATRMSNPADIAKLLSRIRSEGLRLSLIDRGDYEKSSAKKAIDDLFS